jgi:hypothetical protein
LSKKERKKKLIWSHSREKGRLLKTKTKKKINKQKREKKRKAKRKTERRFKVPRIKSP